jgi:TRAP-type uncharacterized transport system substrate-binding protein
MRFVPIKTAERQSSVRRALENLDRNSFIPYHQGAVRYYREIGVEPPADLVPVD